MRIVYTLIGGGVQSFYYYRTYEEAVAAANFRFYCTGVKWKVQKILISERED